MPARAIELPKTMPAIVCHAPEDYRLEELPVPGVGPGEVLVRVESVGICASDLKCYQGAPLFWGDDRREGYCQPPITPGHEFVGEVVALGEGAGEKYGLAIGDRAVSEQIVPCWQCRFCLTGKYWMCAVHDIYGFRRRTPGAMAGYVRFPAGRAQPQGPGVDAGAPCGVHRAARLLDPRGAARQHRVPGHRGHRRRRPARPRHDRRRPDEAAGAAHRRRPQRRPPRDGEALRRRPRAEPDEGRRGRGGAEADRRLRLRRLHRGHRPSAGGGRRPAR